MVELRLNFNSLAVLLILVMGGYLSNVGTASELRQSAIVKAVKRAAPAVVSIRGEKTVNSSVGFLADRGVRIVRGIGSGVIIDSRGYIITNYHVVERSRLIQVTLFDKSDFVARVIALDEKNDIALLKIDPRNIELRVIDIGTSSDLMLGETAIAIGNPYGYQHTVSKGIISALNRTLELNDLHTYFSLIQTDASINPGSSGGPLLNIDGQVIGINVAVNIEAKGIAFAIPVDKVMEVAAKLISIDRNSENGLGIYTHKTKKGLTVGRVGENSAASEAGIERGDVIERVGNTKIARRFDLERALVEKEEGTKVQIQLRREGKILSSFIVIPESRKEDKFGDQLWDTLGLQIRLIPKDEIEDFELPSEYHGGFEIMKVRPGSPAATESLRVGDVMVGIHSWETISFEGITYILNQIEKRQMNRVKVYVFSRNKLVYGILPLGM